LLVKTFSFRGCIRSPWEILLRRRYRRTRHRRLPRRLSVHSGQIEGQGEYKLLATFNV